METTSFSGFRGWRAYSEGGFVVFWGIVGCLGKGLWCATPKITLPEPLGMAWGSELRF